VSPCRRQVITLLSKPDLLLLNVVPLAQTRYESAQQISNRR
jgi:hypothetical protein